MIYYNARAEEMRVARDLFDEVQHRVRTTGPQAPSVTKDQHGFAVKGDHTVDFEDFGVYMEELAKRGGFTIEYKKKQQEGQYVGGIAALNAIAKMTGGTPIDEDEYKRAVAAANDERE